jgi:hypothetical protein
VALPPHASSSEGWYLLFEALPRSRFPSVVEHASHVAALSTGGAFEAGIELVVTGIEQENAGRGPRTRP